MLLEGIDRFVNIGLLIRNEASADEGPAVLAARVLSALLQELCENVSSTFDAKRQFVDNSPYATQVKASCRKLRGVLQLVHDSVLPKWQDTAEVSLIEIMFTDEGFKRAGGNMGLAVLCEEEHKLLSAAIMEFHEEVCELTSQIPSVSLILNKLGYDINTPPI